MTLGELRLFVLLPAGAELRRSRADTARRQLGLPSGEEPRIRKFPFTTTPFWLPKGAKSRDDIFHGAFLLCFCSPRAHPPAPKGGSGAFRRAELSAGRTSKSPTPKSAGLENAVSSRRRTGRCDGILFKSGRRSPVPPQNYSLFWEMTCLARVASGALGNLRVSSVRRCLAAAFLLS